LRAWDRLWAWFRFRDWSFLVLWGRTHRIISRLPELGALDWNRRLRAWDRDRLRAWDRLWAWFRDRDRSFLVLWGRTPRIISRLPELGALDWNRRLRAWDRDRDRFRAWDRLWAWDRFRDWSFLVLWGRTLRIISRLLELGTLDWNRRFRAWDRDRFRAWDRFRTWDRFRDRFSLVLWGRTLRIISRLPELGALDWNRRFRAWFWFRDRFRAWFRFLVIGGRTLRIISRLRDYDAISITRSRNKLCKTKLLVVTASAFGVVGELKGQLLCTCACRILGDTNQREGNRARWIVCTASPLATIWQSEKLFPVAVGSTFAVWINREPSTPLEALPYQLTRSPV
jgi:hypothetical protein